jgi:pyruvate,water dikinase
MSEGVIYHQDREVPLYLHLRSPRAACQWSDLPAEGVGLLRLEHFMGDDLGIHPLALLYFDRVRDAQARRHIEELTRSYSRMEDLFIDVLAQSLARVAGRYAPRRVLARFSDYTSAEYARLVGGIDFEPSEAVPALGLRGAARYCSDFYRPAFELECSAIHRAREHYGASNISAMIPFCRTVEEADRVLSIMVEQGLHRGQEDFLIYVMAEVPSNIVLADQFASRFDGFAIGTGDLAQLVLGVDAGSNLLDSVDRGGDAVREFIRDLIARAHDAGNTPVHACGPTVMAPGFFEFLLDVGVDAITVVPEDFDRARERIRVHHQNRLAAARIRDIEENAPWSPYALCSFEDSS